LVAIKQLASAHEEDFKREKEILNMISLRNHNHLIKLLATFRFKENYHLIFPLADNNLRGYWADYQSQWDITAVMWFLKQIQGLASAVRTLHNFGSTNSLQATISSQSQRSGDFVIIESEARFGRHGDIKPENILWFSGSTISGDQLGVLQITDIGHGGFQARSQVTPEKLVGTATYEAPESRMRMRISQAYDIWSLGCVYLEYITWLLGGSEMLEAFGDARVLHVSEWFSDDTFYTIVGDGENDVSPRAEIREKVLEWIDMLHVHPRCSQVIHELLDIVLEMLCVDPSNRLLAVDLDVELGILLDRAKKDEHFLLDPEPTSLDAGTDDSIPIGLVSKLALDANEIATPPVASTMDLPMREVSPAAQDSLFDAWDEENVDTSNGADDEIHAKNGLYDRLINPKSYFDGPRELEQSIVASSTVKLYVDKDAKAAGLKTSQTVYADWPQVRFPYQGDRSTNFIPDLDSEVERICRWLYRVKRFSESATVLLTLENRNLTFSLIHNAAKMRNAYFSRDEISILVLDRHRKNVARLVPVLLSKLRPIAETFDAMVKHSVYKHSAQIDDMMDNDPPLNYSRFLEWADFDLGKALPVLENLRAQLWHDLCLATNGYVTPKTAVSLEEQNRAWNMILCALDLGIVSYVGAHIEPFHKNYFNQSDMSFRVGQPFGQSEAIDISRPVFRQRHLQCLGSFLREKPVWVLHPDDNQEDCKLSVSTCAEVFSDIWGPMWKTFNDSNPNEISKYSVGNGIILRWPSNIVDDLVVNDNEVLCHWVPDDKAKAALESCSYKTMTADSFLLIGAEDLSILHTRRCWRTVTATRGELKNRSCLRPPQTAPPTKYLDAESYTGQLGFSTAGVSTNISAQKSYKRREGHSMKDALLELWTNEPDLRDIRVLEARCGVEVSWCTHNSRRRRLIDLLGTKTMLEYICRWGRWKGNDGAWAAYYNAITSNVHNAFSDLWNSETNDVEWQKLFGDAILVCLKALHRTGVVTEGNDRGDLLAFWAPPEETDYVVTIKKPGHDWIALLEDSVTNGSMVVLESVCLELELETFPSPVSPVHFAKCSYKKRRAVQRSNCLTVLQTALDINDEFPTKLDGLKRVVSKKAVWRDEHDNVYRKWIFSKACNGCKIELGPYSFLEVVEAYERYLLVKFSTFFIPGGVRNLYRPRPEGYHRELVDPKKTNLEPVLLCVA
jgi:serine/threonine protein kinase